MVMLKACRAGDYNCDDDVAATDDTEGGQMFLSSSLENGAIQQRDDAVVSDRIWTDAIIVGADMIFMIYSLLM